MSDQLSTAFLDALNEAQRTRHDQPQLADQLHEVIQRAEEAWPTLTLAREQYLLYLALACSRGDTKALALCDTQFQGEIDQALRQNRSNTLRDARR